MVNIGIRSNGCLLCIRRRIKCDETKPSCNRCTKHKTKCPGYRDPLSLKFVSENYNVAVQSARKRGLPEDQLVLPGGLSNASTVAEAPSRTSTTAGQVDGGCNAGTHWATEKNAKRKDDGPFLAHGSAVPGVGQRLVPSWQDRCLCMFFHEFILPENTYGNCGYLSFLPEMYQESRPDPVLVLAVQAASYAAMANRLNVPFLETQARSMYGKALTSVNQRLRNPDKALHDSTIVSVLLLIFFENIASDYYHFIKNHDLGLTTLLELRGDEQLSTSRGRAIFRLARSHMRMREFHTRSPASQSPKWLKMQQELFPDNPSTAAGHAMIRINSLCAELKKIRELDPEDVIVRSRMLELMQSSRACDEEFEQWSNSLPQSWTYLDIEPTLREAGSTPPSESVVSPVHVYQDTQLAINRNFYRVSYVVLHETLLNFASLLGVEDWSMSSDIWSLEDLNQPTDVVRSAGIIHTMKAEICASIPYCLGEIDSEGTLLAKKPGTAAAAYLVLWPLMHTFSSRFSAMEHREVAGRALDYIARVLGIRRALAPMMPNWNDICGPLDTATWLRAQAAMSRSCSP